MAFRRTEIGLPFGKLYFLRHSLEFSFTDGRQIFPVRRRCGFLVKEDRQIITFCHFRAHFFGKRNGFFHGYIPDRNKGNHVHSSHTGMLALMPVQVDKLHSHADGLEHGVAKRFGFTHHGNNQPVMIFVITVIQQLHALSAAKRSHYPVYLLQITSLTEIGDTFYDFIHNPFKLRMKN